MAALVATTYAEAAQLASDHASLRLFGLLMGGPAPRMAATSAAMTILGPPRPPLSLTIEGRTRNAQAFHGSSRMNTALVAVGNFFFRQRNWVFPTFIACVFAIGVPPSQTFGSERLEHAKDVAAILTALAGLTLRGLVIGHRYVQRSGAKKTIQADELFTTGLFSLCRNPLYTGNVLILTGIFLMHGNPYAIVIGTALFTFIYRAIIAAEENYLLQRFGAAYASYCRTVPRWLPNPLRLMATMRSQPFALSRVLIVEYTNIGLTIGALALVEFYEEVPEPLTRGRTEYMTVLLCIIAGAVVWIALMRFLKKSQILLTP